MIENTGSIYLFESEKVLLVWHEKFDKWLPAGGHCEEGEDPAECALRELFEETGYHAGLIGENHLEVNRWNARSVARPFIILREKIPATPKNPAHEHLDFVYLGRPVSREGHGSEKTRWFTQDEVASLEDDVDIFLDSKLVLAQAFPFLSPITTS